jgi:hypothetical protein
MILEITKLPTKTILYHFIFLVKPKGKTEQTTYYAFTLNTLHLNGTLRRWYFIIIIIIISRVFTLLASPAPVEHAQHFLSLFVFSRRRRRPFRVIGKQFVNYDFDPMVSGVNRPSKFLHRVIKNNLSKMAAALERETSDGTKRSHTSTSAHWDRLRVIRSWQEKK